MFTKDYLDSKHVANVFLIRMTPTPIRGMRHYSTGLANPARFTECQFLLLSV